MNRKMIVSKSIMFAMVAGLFIFAVQPRAVAANDWDGAVLLAQAGGTEPRELEPRYKPVAPEEPSSYNSSYIFGMTRGLAASTIHPAGKAPLFLLSIPLDLVFLPFTAIGGFFG
jgi:hypothetical protein